MDSDFICLNCGSPILEETMVGVTVTSVILSIDEDDNVNYGEQENECGEVDHYECGGCGEILYDDKRIVISEIDSLVEWIEKNCREK